MSKNKATGTSKIVPVRYAPLFSDWAFKRVLGCEGGQPLLMALLNDFLARVLPLSEPGLVPVAQLGKKMHE